MVWRKLAQLFSWLKTIRGRLTVWFMGSLLVSLGVFLAITAIVVRNILDAQIDHHLHTVVGEVEKIWQTLPGEREELIRGIVSSQGMIVIILAPDGEQLLVTAGPDVAIPAGHVLQQHLVKLHQGKVVVPHHFSSGEVRFALVPTLMTPGEGTIAVGYSLAVIQETFRRVFLALAILVIIFLILFGVIGYLIARKALAPVAVIAERAGKITSSANLKDRIPDQGVVDELGVLTRVLNSMFDRLQQSFESQQQFFSDAAHTLKTPLTVLRSQLENIRFHPGAPQRANLTTRRLEKKLDQVFASLDQASSLINDLLLLSRTEVQVKSRQDRVNLSDLLSRVSELGLTLAKTKRIKVRSRIEKNVFVWGDESKLLRAFLNLVDNAIKYSQPGGLIVITAQSSDDEVRVSIKDTGIGIPDHELKLVFNRFFRGSGGLNSGTGSGLGLAIAETIIKRHHGSIDLSSQVGRGTEVLVKLPKIS